MVKFNPYAFKAIDRWCTRTDPQHRTVDNLVRYLQSRGQEAVSYKPRGRNIGRYTDREEFFQLLNVREIAGYMQVRGLDMRLTPLLVDSVVRPTMNEPDLQGGAYQFFLEHFHEHPMLEPMIRESIGSPVRLKVEPVYPADEDLMAWLFDPRSMKTYTFSRNSCEHLQTENTNVRREKGRLRSVSPYSIMEEYRGNNAPFSKEYKRLARALLTGKPLTVKDHKIVVDKKRA